MIFLFLFLLKKGTCLCLELAPSARPRGRRARDRVVTRRCRATHLRGETVGPVTYPPEAVPVPDQHVRFQRVAEPDVGRGHRLVGQDHGHDVVDDEYLAEQQVDGGQEHGRAVLVVEQPHEPREPAVGAGQLPGGRVRRHPGQPVHRGELVGERATGGRVLALHRRAAEHATAQRHGDVRQGGRVRRARVRDVLAVQHGRGHGRGGHAEPELAQAPARLHGPAARRLQLVGEVPGVPGRRPPAHVLTVRPRGRPGALGFFLRGGGRGHARGGLASHDGPS